MKSGRGDIFKVRADAICVTTNGVTRSDGRAVMGAGVARIAADRYPGIDKVLGLQIIAGGNHARVLHEGGSIPGALRVERSSLYRRNPTGSIRPRLSWS